MNKTGLDRFEEANRILNSQRDIYERMDKMDYDEIAALFSVVASKIASDYPEKFIEMVEALPEAFPEPWIMKEGHE